MSITAQWQVYTNILLCAPVLGCVLVFMAERRTAVFTLLVFADYGACAVAKAFGCIRMLTPSDEADTSGGFGARVG